MRISNSIRGWNRRSSNGTTLVEVLVVMVIFLIGMLAMLQVFPGGLKILRWNRDQSVAVSLGRAEMERLTGRATQLPEMILPVQAIWTSTGTALQADFMRLPSELGPLGSGIDTDGNVLDASNRTLGKWQLLSGANAIRRVIGEGGPIPAPRAVGNVFGGMLVLQFSPIVYSTDNVFFEVYGNNMLQRYGDPAFGRVRAYEYYLNDWDQSSAYIYLPRSTTQDRKFRLSVTALVDVGSVPHRKDVVTGTPIDVPADPAGGYVQVNLAPLIVSPGEALVSIDPDTLHVARLFRLVTAFSDDPYEYQMLDNTLGLVLFNPAGYNYKVRTSRGVQIPLTGRVNYDVLDWRILREEFRVPIAEHPFTRLQIDNLAVRGNLGADGKPNQGFPIVPGTGRNSTDTTEDFELLDLDTGGVYLRSSLKVDGSRGVVTFVDKDNDPTNGIQLDLLLPGASAPVTVTATGRSVRALYQGTGEWAVQVLKAPSTFQVAFDVPQVAQCYVGSSNSAVGGLATRIYFPRIDAGKKVQIGTIHYLSNGVPATLEGQDFVIQTKPADPSSMSAYPYVDIRTADPSATGFDFATYGYAVADVQGASMSVRVLWNPAFFTLSNDSAVNMNRFNVWLGNWRQNETETFLQRSEN